MRMWMLDPKLLCDKHLLGEHNEIHKHWPSFVKGHSITKRVTPVAQIEPLAMLSRHDALAEEIARRWPRNNPHKSPFKFDAEKLSYLPEKHRNAKVDLDVSKKDLCYRCLACKERINK